LGSKADVFYADESANYVAAFAGRTARSEVLVIISAPDFFRDAALLSRLALKAGLPTVCPRPAATRGRPRKAFARQPRSWQRFPALTEHRCYATAPR
jgi:hypothetical protein